MVNFFSPLFMNSFAEPAGKKQGDIFLHAFSRTLVSIVHERQLWFELW